MPLIEELETSGNWLFRWRGYLPLVTLFLGIVGIRDFAYPHGSLIYEQLWEMMCFGISVIGLGIRIITVGFAFDKTSAAPPSVYEIVLEVRLILAKIMEQA